MKLMSNTHINITNCSLKMDVGGGVTNHWKSPKRAMGDRYTHPYWSRRHDTLQADEKEDQVL